MIEIGDATLYTGDVLDVLKTLPDESVQTCITSPPYFGLRDYGMEGQIGLEPTIEDYVGKMVDVFSEVRRVLKDDGTLWLNLGDSYSSFKDKGVRQQTLAGKSRTEPSGGKARNRDRAAMEACGLKNKDLIGIPWRVALALQADGWFLRQDIIWNKPNPMPESVTDRCTKSHEYIFMLAKSQRYYYDQGAIKEPQTTPMDTKANQSFGAPGGKAEAVYGAKVSGDKWVPSGVRNKRSVWTVTTKPFAGAHFATFPPDLIRPCVLAGAPAGGVVLDPFSGSGTTGMVAVEEGRKHIGIELNPEYQELAVERITPAAKQLRLLA